MELPSPPYVLHRATVPLCVLDALEGLVGQQHDHEGCVLADVSVGVDGRVASIQPAGAAATSSGEAVIDLQRRLLLPTLVDLHTHIDKGHTWPRSPNPDGTRDGAFAAAALDAELYTPDDLARRVEFSLQCAYAYGTSALRTHVVTTSKHASWVWPIMVDARARWAGRVELQLVGMVIPLTEFRAGGEGDVLAALVASHSGILGGSISQLTAPPSERASSLARESLERQGGAHGGCRPDDFAAVLDAFFAAAAKHDLDVDLHVDENGDDCADGAELVCAAAMRHGVTGSRLTLGHLCALALLQDDKRVKAIAAIAAAGATVVSLPPVNMYLQDRVHGRTPRWRGVTLLHELRAAGVRVAIASDNTRDAFYAYGDLDMLDAMSQAVKIAHLDHPVLGWLSAATTAPADAMRLPHGRLALGRPADCIILRARSLNEMLSRSQHDRNVIRAGKKVHAEPPPYETLDDLQKRSL